MHTLLGLATMGETTQIESFLLVLIPKVNMASEEGIVMAHFAFQLMIIVLKLLPLKGLLYRPQGSITS
jgi:hypothetical protein